MFDGVTIDLSFITWFLGQDIWTMAGILYGLFGWLILWFFFFKSGAELWAEYRKTTRGMVGWEWVLLAVDIPDMFIQTPKAVEQIFAHLSGTAKHIALNDKFWLGTTQKWFSFEIVSIEGYIQFLIRTEKEYRDLVEAAIYAQYTAAEITEVEDYVDYIPSKYPHPEYDVFGVDFKLENKDPYSLRTYKHFEYNLSKDAVFSDPMAAILENFTRIGQGENLWMQIVIEPTDSGWKEEGIALVKELMGEKPHHHAGMLEKVGDIPRIIGQELFNIIHWNFEAHEAHDEHGGADATKLSPGMKTVIEAIEDKISKVGFKTKVRLLYNARKEAFHPNRCVEGFIGALSQFNVQNGNSLVPYKTTHEHYDNKHHTKSIALANGLVKAFKARKLKWKKQGAYILNIEELATIWHFPLPFVKAPLVSKAGAKRGEPPINLPVETSMNPFERKKMENLLPPMPKEPEPQLPEELPYG